MRSHKPQINEHVTIEEASLGARPPCIIQCLPAPEVGAQDKSEQVLQPSKTISTSLILSSAMARECDPATAVKVRFFVIDLRLHLMLCGEAC